MAQHIPKDRIKARECRFSVYCPPAPGERDDYHLIKEIVHLDDGTSVPRVIGKENYKRPFYITKKGRQNHQQKKEWEDIDAVIKYESTQSQLGENIAKALGKPWMRDDLRRLNRSPYIYGADIASTSVIKRTYMDLFPDYNTPYSVSTFDVETDVVNGTEEIIMATLACKNRVVTAIQRSFFDGYSDVEARLKEGIDQYLGEFMKERNIQWEILLVDNEAEIVIECFKRAHVWKPDFVAIWNIDFDIQKVLRALDHYKIDPADVFSDPMVPKKYRFFKYKQGKKQKVTASGLVTPIKPPAQWHTVFCPSSFYFIDAMCVFKQIRTGSQEEPSYALDSILDKIFKDKPEIRKLKFAEADGFTGIDWHQVMQERFRIEYVIYNVFDCISMELLDEATVDMQVAMPMFAGCTDFERFNSQPKRLADNLHYFCLSRDKVMGTTSDEMQTPDDSRTIGLEGWITTLPAHLVLDNGLCIFKENRFLRSNIRCHVADLDVSASYPSGGAVFNISKETTRKELISITGVSEAARRRQGINLSGGHVNAVEIGTELFGLPSLEQMLTAFTHQQQSNF